MSVIKMVDIPFLNYHASVVYDKVRTGQPVTVRDIDKLMYGSTLFNFVKQFLPYQDNYVYNKGQFFTGHGNASAKTYSRQWANKRRIYKRNQFFNRTRRFQSFTPQHKLFVPRGFQTRRTQYYDRRRKRRSQYW